MYKPTTPDRRTESAQEQAPTPPVNGGQKIKQVTGVVDIVVQVIKHGRLLSKCTELKDSWVQLNRVLK